MAADVLVQNDFIHFLPVNLLSLGPAVQHFWQSSLASSTQYTYTRTYIAGKKRNVIGHSQAPSKTINPKDKLIPSQGS